MKTDREDNFEEYTIQDEEEQDNYLTLPQIWRALLKAMVMPSAGWKQLHNSQIKPENIVVGFLLPISLLAAASDLFSLLYEMELRFTDLLVGMVITFFTYFLGYYIAVLIARIFMPKADKGFPMTGYGRLLIIDCVAALAVIHVIYQALQIFDFMIEFFPLWTVYMLYKGMNYAKIDSNKATFSLGVMCVAVISSPVLINWFFDLFTPDSVI